MNSLLGSTLYCSLCCKVHESSLGTPNHNKHFQIYIDSSSYKMEATNVQDYQPAAFLSHKLNAMLLKYVIGDKETISIVIVLTKFCTMLLGVELHIHTDHLNIISCHSTPQLSWTVTCLHSLYFRQRKCHC